MHRRIWNIILICTPAILLAACSQAASVTPIPAATITVPPIQTVAALQFSSGTDLILLSLEENGYAHLFAYAPPELPLTRLTADEWNDIAPAPSPDHNRLAFASDRDGFWDLYLLDLRDGQVTQLTDSPAYDSAPSWSPDGQWLAYETYLDDNLEIAIISVTDPSQGQIRLTENGAADHSPVWSPDGRRIAFVSTRSGDSDIWLADLDLTEGKRFQNLSNTPQAAEYYPAWDSNGSHLVWASSAQAIGYSGIYLWEKTDVSRPPRWLGEGTRAAWDENDHALVTAIESPNQQYLTAYDLKGSLLLATLPLPGRVRGLTWGHVAIPSPLPEAFARAAAQTPTADWTLGITPVEQMPGKRWNLVTLPGVQAPYPRLHDLVDESFIALRQRVLHDCGWDALASLENAFVPLSISLNPGYEDDWLYTGRAFAINSLMANAGWLVANRVDYGAQTYWHLYLRCLLQDGSLGEPLHDPPWDLTSRYDLDPQVYEQGGKYVPVPPGYWLDLTALAAAYGWERLPALPNWRNYYEGTRFTEFAMTGGLDWYSAMLELYPAEALVTPTHVMPPTLTPTRTPFPTITSGPSRTPPATFTPSLTPTPRPPTSTPLPTPTPPTIIP
jgi:TolB protein